MESVSQLVSQLLREIQFDPPAAPLPEKVSAITADSRELKPGCAFVAVRGTARDGHEFLPAADAAGAALLVGEEPAPRGLRAPYLRVANSRLALARLAAAFHGHPSRSLKMVGVTGTSGKTTTTYLVESILAASGRKPALIGTVTYRFTTPHGVRERPSTHTTPGAVELQSLLAEVLREGCDSVVMEVSSHALKQARTAGIAFDCVVFTNMTPEHLDFHSDMEDYYRSKAMLFTEYARYAAEAGKKLEAVVNTDDAYGRRLLKDARVPVHSYGLAPDAELSGARIQNDMEGTRGEVAGVRVASPLAGTFNVSNILAAIGVGKILGLPEAAISRGIAATVVPGRLQKVPNRAGIHVLVDYAHKPDALEKVLASLQATRKGHRLITVFGCGGDRDRTKRPVMARIASELSDRVWITSDNPRTENPDAIIEEILKGVPSEKRRGKDFEVEPDRRKAIFAAIQSAAPGDSVLIAGKGHEDYQILADPSAPGKTRKIHFDDREVASEALAGLKKQA